MLVEDALFRRAAGYSYTETVLTKVKTVQYHPETGKKISETEEVVATEAPKTYPPETAAIRFWLTKRQPGKWGDGSGEDPEIRVVFDDNEM